MNYNSMRTACFVALIAPAVTLAPQGFAREPQAWDTVPESVRTTVLAHGGKAGQQVDKETKKINGLAVFEAGVMSPDGTVADLVITEDGTLVQTKHDDAADRAAELAAAQARKAAGASDLPIFSHPRNITHPYLPLASLQQDVLEGTEDGDAIRIERTLKPDIIRTFRISKQTVEALAVEDREFEDGRLTEVTVDYFAQDDEGTVYYLGEDVDEYADGKIVGHEGAWLLGRDTKRPGVILPAHPKVGDQFKSEDVSADIREDDEIVSVSEDAVVGAGAYQHCLKVTERLADGSTEYKYYAPGVGVVREVPSGGDVRLKSHTTR